MPSVMPCLWFDDQAEEAVRLYTSLFEGSRIKRVARYGKSGAEVSGRPEGSVMEIELELAGQPLTALNGGPIFRFTPAHSLFVACETAGEMERLWKELSRDGTVRMALDKYPWSERYGWTADRFGVEWQFILSPQKQKISPAFLFVDGLFGKARQAIEFYTGLFSGSEVLATARDESSGTILHSRFRLGDCEMVVSDGPGTHGFEFSHAFSLMVNCKTQSEIDFFWTKLSEGGDQEPCGWVKDRFGVSWQIVYPPAGGWLADPKKGEAVMSALLGMKRPDIAVLERAFQSA